MQRRDFLELTGSAAIAEGGILPESERLDSEVQTGQTPVPPEVNFTQHFVNGNSHSVFADPPFIDPANHDVRLRPKSPALKLGFVNFEIWKWG
jgi:hypothetical protein